MDKKQAEVEQAKLKHEQKAYRELKNTYNQALDDIKGRVLNLQNKLNELNIIDTTGMDDRSKEILESMKQSKIYQLDYQKALEKEIGAILDVTKQKNVTNIQTFLNKMYQESYLGLQYDLNSKGIPIITPINPSLVVKSVNKETKGMTFAQREIANMNDFKKAVKSEISRGIANGSTYSQMAEQLSMKTNEALYKSKRIVRTEGCRVSSEAKLTSMRDEIEKGADLVKVWDSTLDGKTRPLHMQLDQQIKEINEPFEIDGIKVQAPGLFGDPGQDCNCRCVVQAVPRWDIEETKYRIDNETKSDIIKVKNYEAWANADFKYPLEMNLKNFDEWKDDYKKLITENEKIKNAKKEISSLNKEMRDVLMSNYEETRIGMGLNSTPIDKLLDDEFLFQVNFGNVDVKIAEEYVKSFKKLSNEYYSSCSRITQTRIMNGPVYAEHTINRTELNPYVFQSEIFINDYLDNYKNFSARLLKNPPNKNITEKNMIEYIATHEYAHTFSLICQDKYKSFVGQDVIKIKKFNNRIKEIRNNYIEELTTLSEEIRKLNNKFILDTDNFNNEDKKKLNELVSRQKDIFISEYSKENEEEFFAEAFADAKIMKNPSPYSLQVLEEIDKIFKKR